MKKNTVFQAELDESKTKRYVKNNKKKKNRIYKMHVK